MTLNELTKGSIVQHFKRELMTADERKASPNKYTYEIIGTAMHTETEETLVIYRALYGDMKMYARPAEMFLSEVDREKHPDVKQKFRFESATDVHIAGRPMYKHGDNVRFEWNNGVIKAGIIKIVDSFGTFEQREEPSYDLSVSDELSEHTLYKHVRESDILGYNKD
ncbi:MAG: DUF1653 domain-containing protein [Oscillospiraceae bacterium]|nr:DUF1653 domain-containing protein [Oscillospiraceae bacterium]